MSERYDPAMTRLHLTAATDRRFESNVKCDTQKKEGGAPSRRPSKADLWITGRG